MTTQNKRIRKSGFTIVELVIVIAVIAILAAVLIPTFAGLIQKANQSNDVVMVKNLNTLLATDKAVNGADRLTINRALKVAEENGYSIEKLTPTSEGNLIIWNELANEFVLVDAEEMKPISKDVKIDDVDEANLWLIEEQYNADRADYSQYIKGEITAALPTVTAGISVGTNENIDVTYVDTADETVSFVMNGGKLTVNNPAAVVHSYELKNEVEVVAVDTASYHEWGEVVGNISIAAGRLVIEAGSDAHGVIITATEPGKVKLEVKSSDRVTVAAIQAIIDELGLGDFADVILMDDAKKAEIDLFAGGLGTEASPYLISTAEEFLNIDNDIIQAKIVEKGNAYYFALSNDIEIGTTYLGYLQGELDGNGYSLTVGSAPCLFYATRYDVTVKNLTILQKDENIRPMFYGINGTDGSSGVKGKVTFSNVTVDSVTGGVHKLDGNNKSSFTWNVAGEVTFENCTNNVDYTISSTGYGGIFVGGYAQENYRAPATLRFINCVNTGTVTGGQWVGFFSGNDAQASGQSSQVGIQLYTDKNAVNNDPKRAAYYIENCVNEGVLVGTKQCEPIVSQCDFEANEAANATMISNGQFKPGTMVIASINDMSLVKAENKYAISTSADSSIDKYKVYYYVGTSFAKEDGSSIGTSYVRIVFEFKATDAANAKIDIISKVILDTEYDATAEAGKKYADLASTGKLTDDVGNEYVLVDLADGTKAAVINSAQAMKEFHSQAAVMKVGGEPRVMLVAQNATGVDLGAKFYQLFQIQ